MTDLLSATRRVQALRSIGYTPEQIAQGTGASEDFILDLCDDKITTLPAGLLDSICEFFRVRQVQPLHNIDSADRERAAARKRGWAPPYSWDDIDDPNDWPKGALGIRTGCVKCGKEPKPGRYLSKTGLCASHYQAEWRRKKREKEAAA